MSSLSTSSDHRDMMTILRRTGAFDWELLGVGAGPSTLSQCLGWQPADMDRSAASFERAGRRVAAGFPAGEGPDPGPLAYAPWVSATAGALSACPSVAALSGQQGPELADLCTRDSLLRTIAHYGGRAKDGAMDVRLTLGAFGWYVIRDVVAGLREQVAGMGRKEAELFLAPFSPMLVLLGQIMTEREENRLATAAKVDKLAAEVQEAREDRDAAEAELRLQGEPRLPRETLLEMARRSEDKQAPPPGRTRRTRR